MKKTCEWPPIRSRQRILLTACFAALLSTTATAQPEGNVMSTIRECQRIEAMSARLACYDRAFPPGGEQQASIAEAAPTRAAAAPAAASQSAVPEDSADRTVSIVQVRQLRPRETIFYADDGRVYMQTGGAPRLRVPEPPFEATLEAGAFGSTFIRLPNDGPRVRVALRD